MKNKITHFFFCILLSSSFYNCEFEPYGGEIEGELIRQETDLYNYLQLVANNPETPLLDIGCVEFIYPFLLFIYDEELSVVRKESVLDNENFTSLLSNLEKDYAISLSYPISGKLEDGTSVIITSNEELLNSLNTCIKEKLEIILGDCNAIVQECVWSVTESSTIEDQYLESVFKLEDDGSVTFETQETTYNGTWVFYFIGNILHLNIHFEYNQDNEPNAENNLPNVKDDWNYDWEITYIDEEKINLENTEEQAYTIERICEQEIEDGN